MLPSQEYTSLRALFSTLPKVYMEESDDSDECEKCTTYHTEIGSVKISIHFLFYHDMPTYSLKWLVTRADFSKRGQEVGLYSCKGSTLVELMRVLCNSGILEEICTHAK